MTDLPPDVDRYRILGELGRGAHSVVHLAKDVGLGRRVALKIFATVPGVEDPAVRERFRRETAALSRLGIPGVPRLYGAGESPAGPWIAMSLVEGRTLAEHLAGTPESAAGSETGSAARPRLDRSGLLCAVAGAARAIEGVHRAGIVHGDLKPGNLMVTPDGGCVILDFGESRTGEETRAGPPAGGTLPYLAPERLSGGGGPASDIWSLGIVLHEALSGNPPFTAPTRERLVAAILAEDPPDLERSGARTSRDLAAVVERCLAKDPERRYASALDLAEELDRVRRGEPVRTRRASTAARLWRSARRHRAVAFLAVFLPLALGAGLFSVNAARREEDRLLRLAAAAGTVAGERSAEAARLLQSFLELSDIQRFLDLDRRASRLWPPRPEIVPELERWIADAVPLAARSGGRRQALELLRAGARRSGAAAATARFPALAREIEEVREGIAALSARAGEGGGDPRAESRTEAAIAAAEEMVESLRKEAPAAESYEYDDPGLRLQDDILARIVAGLEHLNEADPHRTTIASARRRIEAARALGAPPGDEVRAAWERAIASIADRRECPAYGGLHLAPQPGLVPLGRDPESGLWEFHHAPSGSRPFRDAAGRWTALEDSGLVLVLVPGGRATLGARLPDAEHPAGAPFTEAEAEILEGPVHEIDLAPFFLSKYEMTQGQWLRASGRNPSGVAPPRDGRGGPVDLSHPVEGVSWREAAEVLWHLGLDLPTEAQWEHAARGGTTGPRWTGEDLRSLDGAVNAADRTRRTASPTARTPEWFDDGFADHAPVGSFRANPFGLHDVFGNVWEWCRDAYDTYRHAVFQEGDGELLGLTVAQRVYRGGGSATPLAVLRSAKRNAAPPGSRTGDLGVRPARRLE